MKSLGERGVKNLAVIMPGFAADCLETLEEIAMENAEIFKHAGGKNFAAIPCLNDSDPGMAVIRDVALRELKGLDLRPFRPVFWFARDLIRKPVPTFRDHTPPINVPLTIRF